MKIFTADPGVISVTHGDKRFPVVDQVADVPDELGEHLIGFPHWELYIGQESEAQKSAAEAETAEDPQAAKERPEPARPARKVRRG